MRSAVFWLVTTAYAGVCQREPCTKVRLKRFDSSVNKTVYLKSLISVLSCGDPRFGVFVRFETKMFDAHPCRRVL